MKRFRFDGIVPASKSHFNRALICASYSADVQLQGESSCDDVIKMKKALEDLGTAKEYDCGSAGTVLRFLAFRLSRIPGRHILKGTERLFSRPQNELKETLQQLGIQVELQKDRMILEGSGWSLKKNILHVSREKSSQFASGVLLNSWNLDFPLEIQWEKNVVSEGYWQMTVQLVKDFGMQIAETENGIKIQPRSKVQIQNYQVESDLSSTFALAAYAALNGEATFRHFPFQSLQPDKVFISIFREMGVGLEQDVSSLRVFQNPNSGLKGIHWNINNCPDLFPVLATLCAFAKGPSRLDGAPHLVFKESNRIEKTAELIRFMGVQAKVLPDGMEIHPPEQLVTPSVPLSFDTDHDHRLAFAAALLASQNYPIKILHPEVVNKSFPEFWDLLVHK